MPGFARGLSIIGNVAAVGLSKPRNQRFEGLQLDEELKKRDAEPWCGVQIVSPPTATVEWIRFDGAIRELFDVRVLPGVVCPMGLPTFGPELASFVTIEAPDRPLGEHGPT